MIQMLRGESVGQTWYESFQPMSSRVVCTSKNVRGNGSRWLLFSKKDESRVHIFIVIRQVVLDRIHLVAEERVSAKRGFGARVLG